jgi:protein-tyrosine phosphatase
MNILTTHSKIEDNLYLGNLEGAKDLELLKSLGTTHILVVGKELPTLFRSEFIYRQLPLKDEEEDSSPSLTEEEKQKKCTLSSFFQESFEFIEESLQARGVVFVHCAAGISRSPAIIIAYLMKKHMCSYWSALEQVIQKRPPICPNLSFKRQLSQYEKFLGIKEKLME